MIRLRRASSTPMRIFSARISSSSISTSARASSSRRTNSCSGGGSTIAGAGGASIPENNRLEIAKKQAGRKCDLPARSKDAPELESICCAPEKWPYTKCDDSLDPDFPRSRNRRATPTRPFAVTPLHRRPALPAPMARTQPTRPGNRVGPLFGKRPRAAGIPQKHRRPHRARRLHPPRPAPPLPARPRRGRARRQRRAAHRPSRPALSRRRLPPVPLPLPLPLGRRRRRALPAGHVVGPDEAQAILWDATATARAGATQSAQSTATRVREQQLLADDLTRAAAEAQSVATQSAATPTAFSQMATATAYAFDLRARETAYAGNAVATQAAVVQRAEPDSRWGLVSVIAVLVLVFGVLVFAVYLHNLGKVHLANLMLRDLGHGIAAILDPKTGWNFRQTPLALPQAAPGLTPDERAEQAHKAYLAQLDAQWRTFYRRLVLWAHYARSWSNSTLCDDLDVLSDDAWRDATEITVTAGYLIRMGGRNKRGTDWHPDWNYDRFVEKNMAAYLPHPTLPPRAIKAPPYHNTTPPQPATTPQSGTITLYAHDDPP